MSCGKKFLVIGNQNAITYKEVFPLIMNNKVWYGVNGVKSFRQADNSIKVFGNICWFTNIEHSKHHEELDLYKKYNAEEYPKYDNYDAIEVSKVADIPMDYYGVMGVPITFLDKYCPEQFEIIGCTANPEGCDIEKQPRSAFALDCIAKGKLLGAKCVGGNSNLLREGDYLRVLYHRILIRRK